MENLDISLSKIIDEALERRGIASMDDIIFTDPKVYEHPYIPIEKSYEISKKKIDDQFKKN